ncbi:Hsp20/alpha crystallin family protein [Candidatus Desulforudis audaxviator]|uniref:Heat shock protein Hsp20 n=1 Tax=Desulforudis audaxviator (strain MP104C) TaxID=477974 RepID=B1I1Q9_DESAP|nr:Hsp20/alpha crystallin family protein [Candidatus Desulforudis audaxviator]ACA59000.1 heat shock protein Hsp20 [Candidatus Desulforudis audaxviator MP104C]AZK59042.1 heat shock protein Hsp20 [Candidatus Desulforudis audaxviator]
MALMRWDPFRDMQNLQRAMNRLFDESLLRSVERDYHETFGSVDLFETADSLIVYTDVPGVKQEDIKIQILGNQLVIQAERAQTVPENSRQLRLERPYGTCQRSFTIGVPVKQDAVKATLRNGVLEIVLPKSDESRPKQIEILAE